MGRRVHPRGGLGSLPRRQISKMAGQGSRSGRRHAPRPRDHRGSQPKLGVRLEFQRGRCGARPLGACWRLLRHAAGIRLCSARASSWHRGPRSCGPSFYRRAVRVGRRLLFVSRGAAAVAASSGPRGARRPVACLRYRRSLRPPFLVARLSAAAISRTLAVPLLRRSAGRVGRRRAFRRPSAATRRAAIRRLPVG